MTRMKQLGGWLLPFVLGALIASGLFLVRRPGSLPLQALSRRVEATIYLPTTSNDQQPFSEVEWQGALRPLVTEFGGATLGPPMEGFWYGKGKLQREPVRPVTISFEPGRLKRFQQLVRELGRALGQESIYTRFEEPRIELANLSNEV